MAEDYGRLCSLHHCDDCSHPSCSASNLPSRRRMCLAIYVHLRRLPRLYTLSQPIEVLDAGTIFSLTLPWFPLGSHSCFVLGQCSRLTRLVCVLSAGSFPGIGVESPNFHRIRLQTIIIGMARIYRTAQPCQLNVIGLFGIQASRRLISYLCM
jgi:hypothetical protein